MSYPGESENTVAIYMQDTDLMLDMRLFVSFVNWHFTFLLVHSVQLVLSVASHCRYQC